MNLNGTYSDPALMDKLSKFRMPFGKHAEMLLTDLPLAYLSWFSRMGFPNGELGQLMRVMFDIKSGNLQHLLTTVPAIRKLPATESVHNNNSIKHSEI